jgi:hypothetical protein
MAGNMEVIWVGREAEYFLREDWTDGIRLKLKENFFSARSRSNRIMAWNASIQNAALVWKRGMPKGKLPSSSGTARRSPGT